MLPDRLVMMANQIGKFFATQSPAGQPGERAVRGIADHLHRFWDPRMRTELICFVQGGGEGLDPLPLAAVRRLEAERKETLDQLRR